jgi:hypothetical protein
MGATACLSPAEIWPRAPVGRFSQSWAVLSLKGVSTVSPLCLKRSDIIRIYNFVRNLNYKLVGNPID